MDIRITEIVTGSRANGPGNRNVVWFQGCTLNCPGCFNPQTHPAAGGFPISTDDLCEKLLDLQFQSNGITISGGEPFQQAEGLLDLLVKLKQRKSPPVLVFSGYTFSQLQDNPIRKSCLSYIDALICGPYRRNEPPAFEHFCSSANQELRLLSSRLQPRDFSDLPLAEIIIDRSGKAFFSGICTA
ncbi:MAG: radical SAM protein [Anaerolineaceae bacterium]|nr:radical SAM protein [Anaerolineaceae bacterium]